MKTEKQVKKQLEAEIKTLQGINSLLKKMFLIKKSNKTRADLEKQGRLYIMRAEYKQKINILKWVLELNQK